MYDAPPASSATARETRWLPWKVGSAAGYDLLICSYAGMAFRAGVDRESDSRKAGAANKTGSQATASDLFFYGAAADSIVQASRILARTGHNGKCAIVVRNVVRLPVSRRTKRKL
jgi:hypothetical protein